MAEAQLRKAGMKCKVGNLNCAFEMGKSLAAGPIGVVSCDICCSESDFCRDCMCILCGTAINCDYTPYTSIRCLARLSGAGFCGHAAHLMCALECRMAGVVKSLGLDMEYMCRRCDQKTDLRENIVHLLGSIRYTNSSSSVQSILGMALHIMQGTEHGGAKSLESLIKTAIHMVEKGANIREVFDMLHGTGAEALTAKFDDVGEPSELEDEKETCNNSAVKKVKETFTSMGTPMSSADKMQVDITEQEVHEVSEYANDEPRVKQCPQKDNVGLDTSQPPMIDTSEEASKVSLTADASIQLLNAGFENDIQEALNKLRESQAAEYELANDKLNAQKEYIMKLYKQLEVASPLLKLPAESANASTEQVSCSFQELQKEWTNFQTNLLLDSANASMDQVSYTFQELQKESSNLETMLGIRNGFGQTSKVILDKFFGLPMEQE